MKTMLEHQKLIIDKLSYNSELFKKEIIKSAKWLSVSEMLMLFSWLISKYWNSKKPEIKEVMLTL
ncbi:MAG: hypothetical protein JXA77_16340 [Bacteroidales bacterium]|nr:hypothetical protein [Bacteroidales bacterium]MBN2818872.1 hypothetical protein [Bacteroidales bacterium]